MRIAIVGTLVLGVGCSKSEPREPVPEEGKSAAETDAAASRADALRDSVAAAEDAATPR
jgi:hypothetical protein